MTNNKSVPGGQATYKRVCLRRPRGLILLAALAILTPRAGNAQATAYAVIHSFKGNPDGADPEASVVIDKNGSLYGTTYRGGTSGSGTVYKLTKPTGGPWQETVLYSFSEPNGSYPRANLVFGSSGAFYGTTASGPTNYGTIFELAPPRS